MHFDFDRQSYNLVPLFFRNWLFSQSINIYIARLNRQVRILCRSTLDLEYRYFRTYSVNFWANNSCYLRLLVVSKLKQQTSRNQKQITNFFLVGLSELIIYDLLVIDLRSLPYRKQEVFRSCFSESQAGRNSSTKTQFL